MAVKDDVVSTIRPKIYHGRLHDQTAIPDRSGGCGRSNLVEEINVHPGWHDAGLA